MRGGRRRELHDRPVGVVAGARYADAPLIAVNTLAKRAGVRSGDRLAGARLRCRGFAVRPQRIEHYVAVHDRMVEAVGRVLPVSALHPIDELSARLPPRDDPPSLVECVKRFVADALPERVPVSVGAASGAWLAKTAAEANKRIGKTTHRSALPARKAAILDHAELEMPLVQAIEEALAFVEKHSSHGAAIGPVRRKDRWSLPPAAVREAIVNAVAHADYSQHGAPIRVAISDDRLEVESVRPGRLSSKGCAIVAGGPAARYPARYPTRQLPRYLADSWFG